MRWVSIIESWYESDIGDIRSVGGIRDHIFYAVPALVLREELLERCAKAGIAPKWLDVLRDLSRLQEAMIEQGGKRPILRPPANG
jgi:hypothetical protein